MRETQRRASSMRSWSGRRMFPTSVAVVSGLLALASVSPAVAQPKPATTAKPAAAAPAKPAAAAAGSAKPAAGPAAPAKPDANPAGAAAGLKKPAAAAGDKPAADKTAAK